jgi:hypothetical protein
MKEKAEQKSSDLKLLLQALELTLSFEEKEKVFDMWNELRF